MFAGKIQLLGRRKYRKPYLPEAVSRGRQTSHMRTFIMKITCFLTAQRLLPQTIAETQMEKVLPGVSPLIRTYHGSFAMLHHAQVLFYRVKIAHFSDR